MNETEFYKRITKIFLPEKLHGKKVVVIGLGSGGCRVAAELGRMGVSLVLVERPGEVLLEHNIIRHLLGYKSLGRPKLDEMARYIHDLNPSVGLECWDLDVVESSDLFEERLRGASPSLVAVCTDSEESKHTINAACLGLQLPQVGGGVYDGGVGGEVYLVRPGQACYGCIAEQLQLRPKMPQRAIDIDYSHLDLDEFRSTCALALDIAQIALLQVRLALNLLLEGDPDLIGLPQTVNLCVFTNRTIPAAFSRPWHGDFFAVPRSTSCLSCGDAPGDVAREATLIRASLKQPVIAPDSNL
jgi:molybdopterin/thiamine biosynthesis adenylyltransferase